MQRCPTLVLLQHLVILAANRCSQNIHPILKAKVWGPLLAALDERAGADASVLLLDDYLKMDVSPDWIRSIRARRAVSSWTRSEDDPVIVIPIFIK